MSRRRGFTLLEVMVAIAILAVAMGVIMEIESNAILKTNDAKMYTVATLLARGKILDVQEQLREEGFGDFMKVLEGDFEEEGFTEFRWVARVRKIEVPTPTGMPSDVANQPAEGSGGMSIATLAPMLQNMGNVLEGAVREIEIKVIWMDGKYENDVSLITHVVSRELLATGMAGSGLTGGLPAGLPAGLPGMPGSSSGSKTTAPTKTPVGPNPARGGLTPRGAIR